jgi:hypothetical protein
MHVISLFGVASPAKRIVSSTLVVVPVLLSQEANPSWGAVVLLVCPALCFSQRLVALCHLSLSRFLLDGRWLGSATRATTVVVVMGLLAGSNRNLPCLVALLRASLVVVGMMMVTRFLAGDRWTGHVTDDWSIHVHLIVLW